MSLGDRPAARAAPAGRLHRSGRRSNPSRGPAPGLADGSSTASGGMSRAIRRPWPAAAAPSDRGWPGRRRCCPTRRPSRARRSGAPDPACPGPPTAAPASRDRAGTARTPAVRRRLVSVANSTGRSGRAARRPAAATARSRWPGSRRRAGTPACGTSSRSATASIAASKQSDGDCGATIGTGASPLRPNIACSRSDCSVLVGSPVDGPPRCTSMTTSGSSSDDGEADRLRLQRDARTGGRGHARARHRTRRPAPRRSPAISSSAWKVRTPNRLVLRQLVQDVARRCDRVGAEEQRQPARRAAAISPYDSATLPEMLR